MYNSTHELPHSSPYDNIPTVGVLRLVSDRRRDQPHERSVNWESTETIRTDRAPSIEDFKTTFSTRTLHSGRNVDQSPDIPTDELSTIGVIKLVQPDLLRKSMRNEPQRNVHGIDRTTRKSMRDFGTQTITSWSSLIREKEDSTVTTKSRPNAIGTIKLTTPKSSDYRITDEVDFERSHKSHERRVPTLFDSSTEPAVTWPQLISTVKELVEEELSYQTKSRKTPLSNVFKLKSTKHKHGKGRLVHQGTDPEQSWDSLVTQLEEETEMSVTQRTQQKHEDPTTRTVSTLKLQTPQTDPATTETRGTQPDFTWNQVINVIRDETEEIILKRQSMQQKAPCNLGSFHIKAQPKATVTDSATQPELTWPQLVRIIQEEIEDIVTRSRKGVAVASVDTHETGTQPEIDWPEVIHLVRQEIMTQIHETKLTEESSVKSDKTPLKIFKLVGSEEKSVSKQDQMTGPEFTWGQIVRIIRNETEEMIRRDMETSADNEVKECEDATTEPELTWPLLVRIVQQETEEIVRKKNMKITSDTATSPQEDWSTLIGALEDTAVEEYKVLQERQRQSEAPPMIGIFKLKTDDTRPHPVVEEKEVDDASTEPELTWPLLMRIVQEEVEDILIRRNIKKSCDKGTNPETDWESIVGTIEETAIEEYKKVSRRVPDEEPPMIGIFKLKAEEKRRAQYQPSAVTVDKGTQPRTSWDRIISIIEENAVTSYKEKRSKSELPKPTSVGVIKLTTPSPARKADSFTQSDDPDLSDSFTQPEQSWRDLLRGLKEELESEYIKTIRELEAHIAAQDEPDFPHDVQSLGIFTLKGPKERKRLISDSFTQIFTPVISEKSTQPEKSWPQLITEIEESTEMRIHQKFRKPKVTQGTSQTEPIEQIPITPVIIREEFLAPHVERKDCGIQVELERMYKRKTADTGTQIIMHTTDVTTSTPEVPESEEKSSETTPEVRDAAVSAWKISSRSFTTQFDAPAAKSQHAGQQTSISVLERGSSTIKEVPCFAGVQVSPAYESHSTSVQQLKRLSSSVQVSLKKDTRESASNTVTRDIADAGMGTESPLVAESGTTMEVQQTRDACVSADLSPKKQVVSYYLDQLKKKPKMEAASIQCDLVQIASFNHSSTQYDKIRLDSKSTQLSPALPNRKDSSTQSFWPTKTEGSLAKVESHDATTQAIYEPPIVPVESVQSEMNLTWTEPPKEVQMIDASTSDDLVRKIDNSTQIYLQGKNASTNTRTMKLVESMTQAKPSVISVMSTIHPTTQHVSMHAIPDGKDFTQQTNKGRSDTPNDGHQF